MAAKQAQTMTVKPTVNILWDDILMVSIFGVLDSEITQSLMEAMLSKIEDTLASVVILDILGVATVDTAVANHLFKITEATRLMGCECIISGISPEVAQTIVSLGIDLSSVQTQSTLKKALEEAFKTTGYEVTEV